MKKNKKIISITKTNEIDVQKLCIDNGLIIVNKDSIKSWNTIKRPAINRVGFELLGHFYNNDISMNIIGFGTMESKFMDTINDDELSKKLVNIFKHHPPLIISSINVNDRNKSIILKEATKYNIPVVFTETQLSFIITTLGAYISEFFAPLEFVHGSLVIINSIGVLIIGDSGVGKSEAVLELVQRGHTFVSDDSVNIKRIGNKFVGSSPEITKNFLEARGLGLIDMKLIYGNRSIKEKANINLVVELKHSEKDDNIHFDRLGNEENYFNVLGGKINKIIIPVRSGRNVASLIEVATNLFETKQQGFDILNTIKHRIEDNE